MRSPSRFWRYTALAVIVGNVAFNYANDHLGLGGRSMAEVTARYPNYFTPAGYAFSIWGVIYLAFIVYAAAALTRSQRAIPFHDGVAPTLALANVLASAWVLAYRFERLPVTVALLGATLACAAVMFVRAARAVALEGVARRWAIPFSLFLGWVSVALIANVTILLVSLGWQGGAIAPTTWAVALLGVAALLGATLAVRFANAAVPLVVAWAAIAIAVKQSGASPLVANAALLAAALSGVAAGVGWWRSQHHLTHAAT